MELYEKTWNYLSELLKVRCFSGRLYRVSSFEKESRKIFSSDIQKKYESLIHKYDTDEDVRKGFENQILFVEMAHRLGLTNSDKKLRILDTGSRAGLFPYIVNHFGHCAIATDIPEVLAKPPNPDLFKLFGTKTYPLKINAFEAIESLGEKFDLITGFRTRFHSRYTWETKLDEEIHWGIDEWDFFLKDLARNHTTDQGRIFFMLNRLQEREKGIIIPSPLRKYFISKGAKIHYSFLYFPDLFLLR